MIQTHIRKIQNGVNSSIITQAKEAFILCIR